MDMEIYIFDKLPSVVNADDISALMIFLEIYFWDRQIYRIVSSIVEVDYAYLFGVFRPSCSYEKFLETVNSLKFLKEKFKLEKFVSLLPLKNEEVNFSIDYSKFINQAGISREEGVVVGSKEFHRIAKLFIETEGENEAILVLNSLFGWHKFIIKYFIDNPQDPL